jgi:protoheme IX farnesyltransferase
MQGNIEMSTSTATAGINWRDYLALCKLKVVTLIVFTAVVGMFLAIPGMVPIDILLAGTIGIGMAASSAAAINHLVDSRVDAVMARTRNRPLPSGNMDERHALMFALVLGSLSMVILAGFVNVLTAVLTFVSLIGYAVVYTMYLKRATPQNIVIGGAAGAAPPVLGWTAVTGQLDPHALLLFLIIFVWTPPHFWALAIYRRHEYAEVDIPMLPVTHGVDFTRLQILLYTVLLLLVSVLPYATHMSGLFYLAGALALGTGFLYYAVKIMRTDDERVAMRMFGYSIWYLMALFAFLLVDHYVAPIWSMVYGFVS